MNKVAAIAMLFNLFSIAPVARGMDKSERVAFDLTFAQRWALSSYIDEASNIPDEEWPYITYVPAELDAAVTQIRSLRNRTVSYTNKGIRETVPLADFLLNSPKTPTYAGEEWEKVQKSFEYISKHGGADAIKNYPVNAALFCQRYKIQILGTVALFFAVGVAALLCSGQEDAPEQELHVENQ